MTDYTAILYAGIAVWAGLGLYLCLLAKKQADLSKRLARIEQLAGDDA